MQNNKTFQWAVVGAGPAGIAAIGKLMDNGVSPLSIVWIDPHFKVGDLGQLWCNVSSNTSVARFLDFLHAARSFSYSKSQNRFALNNLPLDETCTLQEVVKPLQWISNHLREQVQSAETTIHKIHLEERVWSLFSENQEFKAKNVILAQGAVPSSLKYPGVDVIPFEIAIDKERLNRAITPDNTFGVFGSSHSAMIIIRYLVDLGVRKVINFYRSPCRYAIDMGDWILFDNTGLKGQTAAWARENIDGRLPPNLVRYHPSEQDIARYLPECSQVIYAVGFERRNNLIIGNLGHAHYNPHIGIIGPGLFGLGIAYPEIRADPFGSVETQVGLWKFMVYLNKVLPTWFKYPT